MTRSRRYNAEHTKRPASGSLTPLVCVPECRTASKTTSVGHLQRLASLTSTTPRTHDTRLRKPGSLYLCEPTVHEQFRSRDVATVVGGEKHNGLCDLIGCTEPAEWNSAGNHLHLFLGRFYRMPWRRVGISWAHCVHANAAILQIRGPCPRERTDRGFGGAINTPLGPGRFTGGGGRIQDDRRTIRQQRKRLLYREKDAFHIAVKNRIVMLLGDLAQKGKIGGTGIREHDIELPLLLFDLCEEPIEIVKVRYVSLYAGDISSNFLYRLSQLRLAAARYEDVRAFVHKLLRCGKANAAIATGNECNFSFKPVHVFISSYQTCQIVRTTLPKGRPSTR